MESRQGIRGKTSCVGVGSSMVAGLQGFAGASSHLEQANSSMQPSKGQGGRWPGDSLPGLTDQTGTLEEV